MIGMNAVTTMIIIICLIIRTDHIGKYTWNAPFIKRQTDKDKNCVRFISYFFFFEIKQKTTTFVILTQLNVILH